MSSSYQAIIGRHLCRTLTAKSPAGSDQTVRPHHCLPTSQHDGATTTAAAGGTGCSLGTLRTSFTVADGPDYDMCGHHSAVSTHSVRSVDPSRSDFDHMAFLIPEMETDWVDPWVRSSRLGSDCIMFSWVGWFWLDIVGQLSISCRR